MPVLSRKIVLRVAVAVSLTFAGVALLSDQGLAQRRRFVNEAARLKQQNVVLKAETTARRGEITALKESRRFQEKVVREDLGYVQSGEQLYLVDIGNADAERGTPRQ